MLVIVAWFNWLFVNYALLQSHNPPQLPTKITIYYNSNFVQAAIQTFEVILDNVACYGVKCHGLQMTDELMEVRKIGYSVAAIICFEVATETSWEGCLEMLFFVVCTVLRWREWID